MTPRATRPTPLKVRPGQIPSELRELDQWVLWRYALRDGNWTKVPHMPDGSLARSNDLATWSSFDVAIQAYDAGGFDGVGFALSPDNDVAGLDIDHRVFDGQVAPEVLSDLALLSTYTELSPSGEGVRAIFRATLPPEGRKRGDFEIYSEGRYLTITGHRLSVGTTEVETRQQEVNLLHARWFTPDVSSRAAADVGDASDEAVPGGRRPSLSDAEIVRRARTAKNGAKFSAVHDGDDGSHGGDRSAADLALCAMLAFWTSDAAQIDRIFRGSSRMREKWDSVHFSGGETYGEHTIRVALEGRGGDDAASVRSDPCIVVPAPGDWLGVGSAFLKHRSRRLIESHHVLYEWSDGAWSALDEGHLTHELWRWLGQARYDKAGDLVRWSPSSRRVANVRAAIRALVAVDSPIGPPCWLTEVEDWPPETLLALANGLLHVPTRTLDPPTSNFFTLNTLPYAYDADAGDAATWMSFCRDVFDHDPSSVEALQEVFGYLVMHDTWLQKIFAFFGPARSGKGVSTRTLERLVGRRNVVATTFGQLGHQFGQESLIGKRIATITDARLTLRTDVGAVIETLLTISGEDSVSVPRKYRTDWHGRLGTRFVIVSNDVPFFPDASTALANRFFPFVTRTSYLGREDHTLEARIATEIPAILNWSLQGYDRLRDRGYLMLPDSGVETLNSMTAASSPVQEFVEEECEIGPEHSVAKVELYNEWRYWTEQRGIPSGSTGTLTKNLKAAYPEVGETRPRGDGARVRCYSGIRLRSADADTTGRSGWSSGG